MTYKYSHKLCASCGACSYLAGGSIEMHRTVKSYVPIITKAVADDDINKIRSCCPAKGYPIVTVGKSLFGHDGEYDYRIGFYHDFFVIKSYNNEILQHASSGGIMTTLGNYLLENHIVDGIMATKFEYDGKVVKPKTVIATSLEQLMECQGSKYMPVPALSSLSLLNNFEGTVAYIGTPCQIAAIRNIQMIDPCVGDKIKYTIGNFCGGYRDLREQAAFIKMSQISNITHFQYRGSGQPGFMEIKGNGKSWHYAYPEYGRLTGYLKNYRCRVCVDAMAELADVSCGDAWIPEYRNKSWSVVVVRNKELNQIIDEMKNKGLIKTESITKEQLFSSQRGNLLSKKERYLSRRKLFGLFGQPLPIYDSGWNPACHYSVLFELKVYFSEILKYCLYKMNLLKLIYR